MEARKLFKEKVNKPLLAQYIRVYQANQRQGTVNTKTRGDVSGGGKKPWRQKGTGRARQGSTRSPIWVKGGVAHGPKPRNWSLNMPAKMRRETLLSALALTESENRLFTFKAPEFTKPATKKAADFLKEKKITGSILVVLPKNKEKAEKNVYYSFRNLENVKVLPVNEINAYVVLKARSVIFFDGAESYLSLTFSKEVDAKGKVQSPKTN